MQDGECLVTVGLARYAFWSVVVCAPLFYGLRATHRYVMTECKGYRYAIPLGVLFWVGYRWVMPLVAKVLGIELPDLPDLPGMASVPVVPVVPAVPVVTKETVASAALGLREFLRIWI